MRLVNDILSTIGKPEDSDNSNFINEAMNIGRL